MQSSMWSGSEAVSRIETYSSVILIAKGKTHQLFVPNDKVEVSEIHELYFAQEETDTRIIMHLNYRVKDGFKSAVLRSTDTGTGVGKHRIFVDVSAIAKSLRRDYCDVVLFFFTWMSVPVHVKKRATRPSKETPTEPQIH